VRPRCSIIIPVYNLEPLTRQCLNAILRLGDDDAVDSEIIVVDDASTDVTQATLAEFGDRLRVVRHALNAGFATSCNDGAAQARGEFLTFLNNDTIPHEGWLTALVAYADAHPTAAVVGSKLLYADGTIQHAGIAIGQHHFPHHIYVGFPGHHPAVEKSRRFQAVTGACFLVRRECFDEVGGFDTGFVNGFEDIDLCLRLGELGHEVHYCHESTVTHLESVSEGRLAALDANSELYRRRWASRVEPDDLRFYVEDGLLSIRYRHRYPLGISLSRELAVVDDGGTATDKLLNTRAVEVLELLKENISLKLRRELSPAAALALAPSPLRSGSHAERVEGPRPHRELFRGNVHVLSPRSSGRLVSIVVPTKNGERQLRELLPRVLDQDVDDDIEIVAVDSGSSDGTIKVLREFRATTVEIDPADFDHGLTRNLAASYARGDRLVYLSQSSLPKDERWLRNLLAPLDSDLRLDGVCSRVIPRHDADVLTRKDGISDLSASADRRVLEINDRGRYGTLNAQELRAFLNFHTVSAALRASTLARIPFRSMRAIGEDLLWAKQVLEAGGRLQHEPTSVVLHSHNYSYVELLGRNVDDGVAALEIVGRRFPREDVEPLLLKLVGDDWHYLEETGLVGEELDHWRQASVLRRAAQAVGQWIGANSDRETAELATVLSLVGAVRERQPAAAMS
jgi:GT2 family glycosyltransferase